MSGSGSARWAEGEPDLVGWIVHGPVFLEDSVGLLVEDPTDGDLRAIYYDRNVGALRSVPCTEDGRFVRPDGTVGGARGEPGDKGR